MGNKGHRDSILLHDTGKISIPLEILNKPGKLHDAEFNIIKLHTQRGYDIIQRIEFPWPIAKYILQHHERIDGSGYPFGLKGEDILPEAKIIAVSDVVEAISAHRPYRSALGVAKALDEIKQNRGILHDEKVVDACLKVFCDEGFDFNFF